MKKILVRLMLAMCVAITSTMSVLAQGSFAYQVVIRDAEGHLISNKTIGMKLKLMHDNVACYEETQNTVTNAYGQASIMVGDGENKIGSFDAVPWSSLNIMLKVELDLENDGTFTDFAEMQIQPVPYALYAASAEPATEIVATAGSDTDAPLFSVKDKDGNIVFAVYRDGVRIFADDSVYADKYIKHGFVVCRRVDTKDGDEELFSVDATGTKVYVGGDGSKTMKHGFAVSGLKATKDGADDIFVVDAEGTHVLIDDDAKTMKHGFAVSGLKATKDDADLTYMTVNADGTQVFVGGDGKTMKHGFAVSGLKATKDGADDIFVVDADGTQVLIDDESKTMKHGFAVSGLKATKDGVEDKYLTVNASGTKVYVDADESKTMKHGFAVSGLKATKDADPDNYFVVDGTGTQVLIDEDSKTMKHGFAVSGLKATKDGQPKSYMSITDTLTAFYLNSTASGKSTFSIFNMNNGDTIVGVDSEYVDFGAHLRVAGDIAHAANYDTLPETLCMLIPNSTETNTLDLTTYIFYYYMDLLQNWQEEDVIDINLVQDSKFIKEIDIDEGNVELSVELPSLSYGVLGQGKKYCIDNLSLCVSQTNSHDYRLLPLKIVVDGFESLEEYGNVDNLYCTINYELYQGADTCSVKRYCYVKDNEIENVWEFEWKTGIMKGKYVYPDEYPIYEYEYKQNRWSPSDKEGVADFVEYLSGFNNLYICSGNEVPSFLEYKRQIGGTECSVQEIIEQADYSITKKTIWHGVTLDYSNDNFTAKCKSVDFDLDANFNEYDNGLLDFYQEINPDFKPMSK